MPGPHPAVLAPQMFRKSWVGRFPPWRRQPYASLGMGSFYQRQGVSGLTQEMVLEKNSGTKKRCTDHFMSQTWVHTLDPFPDLAQTCLHHLQISLVWPLLLPVGICTLYLIPDPMRWTGRTLSVGRAVHRCGERSSPCHVTSGRRTSPLSTLSELQRPTPECGFEKGSPRLWPTPQDPAPDPCLPP